MESHTLKFEGALVYWSLAEWTNRLQLEQGLTALGLELFCPAARTPGASLKSALAEAYPERRVLIRPLQGRDGFTVVAEQPGVDENGYAQVLGVRIVKEDLLFRGDLSRHDRVREEYIRQGSLVHASQVTDSLVSLISTHLQGECLRQRGGLYWLPPLSLSAWREVRNVFEQAAEGEKKSVIYTLRHRADQDALRAIRDAVTVRVTQEAKDLLAEVESGELQSRAMRARSARARALRDDVRRCEDMLQTAMGPLHMALDEAETALATAEFLASAADVKEAG